MSEYSVEEILKAKRVAREAGYDVSLPTDRIEQAKNIARANGYNVRKAPVDPTEMAMRVAKDAGFSVERVPSPNNVNNNDNNGRPAPKTDDNHSWAEKQAAKYL